LSIFPAVRSIRAIDPVQPHNVSAGIVESDFCNLWSF
jgi:hypothetical protein